MVAAPARPKSLIMKGVNHEKEEKKAQFLLIILTSF